MIEMLSSLEMLAVNLLIFDRCNNRKYSAWITALVMTLPVLGIVLASYLLRIPFAGNARYSLVGIVYLIPLKLMYREKISRIFMTMCMAWVYTMGVVALSAQLAGFIRPRQMTAVVVLVETALFLVTVFPFFRIAAPYYLYIIQHVRIFEKTGYWCLLVSICLNFLVLAGLHMLFVSTGSSVFRLLVLLLFLVSTCVFYYVVYWIIRNFEQMRSLEQAALRDALTGLGNRRQLWDDLQELCGTEKAFTVAFMDLDRFKAVNDQYGHLTGDAYLKHFAECGSRILQGYGRMYRFGGDEFVAVAGDGLPEKKLAELRECRGWEAGAPCPFNQVSLGTVVCRPPHPGAEEILRQVDQAMYENKMKKTIL